MRLNNLQILLKRRKELRNHLTPAEASLWNRLKKSQLSGRKFRRQHSFGYFILDFYCPSELLAIELDGSVHETEEAHEYDRRRDAYLVSHGIRVLRFQNHEVLENMNSVLIQIQEAFR